jgi:hypothetical protein
MSKWASLRSKTMSPFFVIPSTTIPGACIDKVISRSILDGVKDFIFDDVGLTHIFWEINNI